MIIKYLIEKEFKQFTRNVFLPKLVFIMPCVMLLILPWAVSMEVKNINLAIVDKSNNQWSHRLAEKISASEYFILKSVNDSYDNALNQIEEGTVDVILEILPDFEPVLIKEGVVPMQISVNAVNGTKGSLGGSYLVNIITDFGNEIKNEIKADVSNLLIHVITQNKFNAELNYKDYMVPALMVMLLTMLCGFLPALNIVSEKEIGTIEQINVTPVTKAVFILSKLIPYWIIGFIVLTIGMIIAWLIYGLIPLGNLLTIYAGAIVYVLVVSGFGLVISNYSGTMQQAMFVMFFFVMILLLMSGLFTPITSMPHWAQVITIFNPLKYFIQIMRWVYLKGSGFTDLITQFGALFSFALFFNGWAVLSYKKSA